VPYIRELGELEMRRSDREVKGRQNVFDILMKCDILRLGINTPDFPYIVPMNFGAELDGQAMTIWLHCAHEGLKLDLIERDPRVGFEADCSLKLLPAEKAGNFSMAYESVIGCGSVSICGDNESKLRGLKALMRHYVPDRDFDFTDSELGTVCVLRIDVLQATGKRNKAVDGG